MNNQWIEWNGGECPVDGYRYVLIRCRNGIEVEVKADTPGIWLHTGSGGEIVAYKLLPQDPHKEWVKIQEGCVMPDDGRMIFGFAYKMQRYGRYSEFFDAIVFENHNRASMSGMSHWRYPHPDPIED